MAARPAKVYLNPANQKITDKKVPIIDPIIRGGCLKPSLIVALKAGNPLAKTKKQILKTAPVLNLTRAIGTTGCTSMIGFSNKTEKAVSA